jgi:ribosomal protein S27AE
MPDSERVLCGACHGMRRLSFPVIKPNGAITKESIDCPTCGGTGWTVVHLRLVR